MRRLLAAYRDVYSGLPRGAWVLAATCFVNRCGTMVLPFLAIYLTTRRGFSAAEAGIALSLYGAGSGIGAFWGGHLTDRIGPKRVQVAALVAAGVGLIGLGQLVAPGAIRVAVFVLAMMGEAFRPANGAAFTVVTPRPQWTQAFTLRRLALNLGMTCGAALGGVLAARNYALLFWVDGGTCLLAGGLLALLDESGKVARPASGAPRGRAPWSDPPFRVFFVLCLLYASVLFQFFTTYPLALHQLHGLPEPQIGSVYAINTLLIVVCEMLLVQRLAGREPLRVAALGNLLFCGGFALLPFVRGYPAIAATVVLWTIGEMLTMPFLETVVAARGGEGGQGRYLGAYSFAFAVAFAGAPLVAAAAYQRYGARPVFAVDGIVGVVLWLGLRALAPRFAETRAAVPRPAPALADEAPVP
jgi:predicted MFS family arabinose efflux permease